MSNQDTHELSHSKCLDRYYASSPSLRPAEASEPATAADEREVALALASFQHSLDRLRHAGAELERFRIQLKQLLLAAALLGDELKYRPLPSDSPEDLPSASRVRSASVQDRLRQALEEVESTTAWSPEFGDETVDDVLRRRVLGVRTRIAELEAAAEPCVHARAQLKAELEWATAKQQRRRISILPTGPLALGAKARGVRGLRGPTEHLGEAQALAGKLALASRTLVEALRSLVEAERQRADDDAELVRATLEHFFRAGLRALQTPRRASASAYRDPAEAARGDVVAALAPPGERGGGLSTVSGSDSSGSGEHGAPQGSPLPPPLAPPRSLADFRPMRKQVRYHYPSSASASANGPSPALKLPTVDELVAFTAKHLPWVRRSSCPSR